MLRFGGTVIAAFTSSARIGRLSQRALRIGVVALGIPLAACSMFNKQEEVVPEQPADLLYNQALYSLNQGDRTTAAKQFVEVDKQHPYSNYAGKAILMTSYTFYRQGKWDDAVTNAKRYLTLHPASPDAPYAQYLIAMSYYNEIPDVYRDQKDTKRAMDAFDELIRKWPESEYAIESKKRVDIAKDQLAAKEMQVGRFYLGRHDYIAAVNRFKAVVTNYQQTRHVEEALERLCEAYMALGIVSEAQTAAAVLGRNYPDSQWYKDAYTLVTSGGATPREDNESWISKAFRKIGMG
jgi:outer membrane protein assembly factor BamD